MWTPTKKITIVCGHYGSGKTNFAVNLALKMAKNGEAVTLVDFDIVNPYFRAADNRKEMEAAGVRCILPQFANTNVDVVSWLPSYDPEMRGGTYCIIVKTPQNAKRCVLRCFVLFTFYRNDS